MQKGGGHRFMKVFHKIPVFFERWLPQPTVTVTLYRHTSLQYTWQLQCSYLQYLECCYLVRLVFVENNGTTQCALLGNNWRWNPVYATLSLC